MDIVHHAAIGGVGLGLGFAVGEPFAGVGFAFGSVLPDLDVAFMALGKRFYLRNHQGVTHSLPLAPLFALGALLLLGLLLREPVTIEAWLGTLMGIVGHALLDACNTFGITLFYPFSRRRFSMDWLFFIDGPFWAVTILAYPLAVLPGNPLLLWGYFSVVVLYLALRWTMHRRAVRATGADYVIPHPFLPWSYGILTIGSETLEAERFNLLTGRRYTEGSHPLRWPAEITDLVGKSRLYRDMARIARRYHIVRAEQKGDTLELEARDLAIRYFGGTFARTRMTFNSDGELIHEVADI